MAEERLNVWVDCDPGIDDAVMLGVLAASGDALKLWGVSSVSGNVPLRYTTANMLALADFLGLPQVPLAEGAAQPLVVPAQDAAHVHGAGGLGGVALPASDRVLDARPAVQAMRDAIMGLPQGEAMTLVPTGPLTNIALLLRDFPEVASRIERIVLMGGSTVGGNVTSVAEFNIWADPDAAAEVFASGLPIVMCGLDVTLKCGLTSEQIDALAASSNERRAALGKMLLFYKPVDSEWENGICVIHDATTLMYLLHPELFTGKQTGIEVDCTAEGRGETRETAARTNVLLLNDANIPAFQQALLEYLAQL